MSSDRRPDRSPIIPGPPVKPSAEEMRRIRWRRKLGLTVFPPLQQTQRPTATTPKDISFSIDARSPAVEATDRLKTSFRLQNENVEIEEEQCRLSLWRNSERRRDSSLGKSSIVADIATDEIWIEYWDEEIEATYYYNPKTGEATWINPTESGRHL